MADSRPRLLASDLEGVLVPEIWIAFAEKTGIEQLRLTTRDVSDYDQLMQMRMKILKERNLRLQDIQEVIATISPLPGAGQFVDWVRERVQFIVLSDTFYEFAKPLMAQLGYPTIFCHSLEVDAAGTITGYRLRLDQSKRKAIAAIGDLQFQTLAMGDSYNDIAMLKRADVGVLFDPPANVTDDYPDLPVVRNYCEARAVIKDWLLDRG
ncbi:MAG: bifunctional phosphoserine phosphatase/homoserine phosphotransferase ThrH [Caldilineaceae bacterium]|nr:bifunctional phosphoserine phosphatase/homoserine phosphotransferase ThrH [Caldilineaceae bacterium]